MSEDTFECELYLSKASDLNRVKNICVFTTYPIASGSNIIVPLLPFSFFSHPCSPSKQNVHVLCGDFQQYLCITCMHIAGVIQNDEFRSNLLD